MAATDQTPQPHKALAPQEPSIHGSRPRRTSTAVDAILVGKERRFNRRFERMCSHHLVEPTACSPAAGWEKGQVENQVQTARQRFFSPRLRVASYAELNEVLREGVLAYARSTRHPEFKDRTIWEVFQEEQAALVAPQGPFRGFHEVTAAVSKTCLVSFDRNRYSVAARAVGRPVQLRAYRDTLAGDAARTKRFNALLHERGVLKSENKFYLSLAHDDADVAHTVDAIDWAAQTMAQEM